MKWLNNPVSEQNRNRIICFVNVCKKRKKEGGPCKPLCYFRQCITKFGGCKFNS